MYHVILYYNYTRVADPDAFRDAQSQACQRLHLLGRVYVAAEGINGTLAGTPEEVARYKTFLRSCEGFDGTAFKDDTAPGMPFRKLVVKTRPELAALKASVPVDPVRGRAPHLSPDEWKAQLDAGGDFVLIDVRNDYEYAIGHFAGARKMDVAHFFDAENWLKRANIPRDKTVLMYCTGGIRCEKFSLLMQAHGYADVRQLDGGIIHYANTVGDDHFKGKCFVFDDRLAVPVEKGQAEPLGRCAVTGVPCDTYINCADPDCNRLFLCSPEGARMMQGCCSPKCRSSDRRRPFNENTVYQPWRKRGHYFSSQSPKRGAPPVFLAPDSDYPRKDKESGVIP